MAVYTEVTDEDLTQFLERYDLGALVSFKGIAEGVENSNYLMRAEQDRSSSPCTRSASRLATCRFSLA
jgi:homoserine kinase type II